MKGLKFFKRMRCNDGTVSRSWVIASYHHPQSITWRWSIQYSREPQRAVAYFMRVYRQQGFNFHAGISLPFLGHLSVQTQPHMWEKV